MRLLAARLPLFFRFSYPVFLFFFLNLFIIFYPFSSLICLAPQLLNCSLLYLSSLSFIFFLSFIYPTNPTSPFSFLISCRPNISIFYLSYFYHAFSMAIYISLSFSFLFCIALPLPPFCYLFHIIFSSSVYLPISLHFLYSVLLSCIANFFSLLYCST